MRGAVRHESGEACCAGPPRSVLRHTSSIYDVDRAVHEPADRDCASRLRAEHARGGTPHRPGDRQARAEEGRGRRAAPGGRAAPPQPGPSARSRKDRDEEWSDEDAEDEEDFASEEAFFGSVWATALPATLTQLSLHFIYCDVGDGGDQALASSLGFRCRVLCVFCVLGVCCTCF